MEEQQEEPIDDILKSIRSAIVEQERQKFFTSFFPKKAEATQNEEEVFELSKTMLVNREDLPYDLGMWNFDDVAKKMLKKYKLYFMSRQISDNEDRVRVKEDSKA